MTSTPSIQSFKNAVVRIRDILRGPGVSITGMDSMRHICLYIMSRYMTDDNVESLGVPKAFAWETLFQIAMTEGGAETARASFYRSGKDCLVRHFDRLFGTENFSFDVKSPHSHLEILKILRDYTPDVMQEISKNMDMLGWVYEDHLRTGSSAARDLGQYFTDRFICDYMTNLCAPKFKSEGVPESVCDPTMGTGGFLTTFIDFYIKHHPGNPINWAEQQTQIHGCDTDPKVAGVARLNLFMKTGGNRTTHTTQHDSLYGDLPGVGYDVILANMPFGLKRIKYEQCCKRIHALKIRGNKSEPLFLQLMMASLNAGGRCAVVVPDGMLANNSRCHNDTRKYLLENFELKRVIKMKGKFFMNTGIQPSILFFENTGTPTEAVEFWEVVRDDAGKISETLTVSVPRVSFDASLSFDVRRYVESLKRDDVIHRGEYLMTTLGDLYDIPKGVKKFNSKDMDGLGDSPFYNGRWDSPVGTHSEQSYCSDNNYFVIISSGGGDHSSSAVGMGKLFKVSGKCSIMSCNYILTQRNDNDITHQYVYYFMTLNVKALRDKARRSINLEHLTVSDIMSFPIPLPPLPIQQIIVATLDRIDASGPTTLADLIKLTNKAMELVIADPSGARLEQVISAQRSIRDLERTAAGFKTLMVSIMESVGDCRYPTMKLSSVLAVVSGKANKERAEGHPVPYYDSNGVIGYVAEPLYSGEYVITARKLSVGSVHYINGPFYPSDNTINFTTLDPSTLSTKFFYYWLVVNNKVLKDLSSGIKPGIRKSDVTEILMPLPPLPIQQQIVAQLDALQADIDSFEAMKKRCEASARIILDSSYRVCTTTATAATSSSDPPPQSHSSSSSSYLGGGGGGPAAASSSYSSASASAADAPPDDDAKGAEEEEEEDTS